MRQLMKPWECSLDIVVMEANISPLPCLLHDLSSPLLQHLSIWVIPPRGSQPLPDPEPLIARPEWKAIDDTLMYPVYAGYKSIEIRWTRTYSEMPTEYDCIAQVHIKMVPQAYWHLNFAICGFLGSCQYHG